MIAKLIGTLKAVIRRRQEAAVVRRKEMDLAAIEAVMLKNAQVEIPLEHIFSAGVYIRKVTIPAGTIVMGVRHRYATCNILLRGVLHVFAGEGEPLKTLIGPCIFTTSPGTKKFAYCEQEAEFANVIPTDETDPDVIEKIFIIPEQEYLQQQEEAKCLSSAQQ